MGNGGDEGERDGHSRVGPHRFQRAAERQDVGLLEPAQDGVPLAAAGEAQVRVGGGAGGAFASEIWRRGVRAEQSASAKSGRGSPHSS